MVEDPQIKRLFRKISQGKAVLFVGAGASRSAGVPGGGELASLIHREFLPEKEQTQEDFIEVCTKVLDTPGVDRSEVEQYIRDRLDHHPSDAHRKLCRVHWQAIFTTNFDDLLEVAYRNSKKRVQRHEPVYGSHFVRTYSGQYGDVVRIFKLMGCVTGRDSSSHMALSRSDYNQKLRERGSLLRILFDYVKDGTLIYVGYSFDDRIARDIIEEVSREVGVDRLPWGWAILPDWDEDTKTLLHKNKVLPLKLTFEEFVDRVVQQTAAKPSDDSLTTHTIVVKGVPVDIPKEDVQMYARQFDFMYEDIGTEEISDETEAKREFLEKKKYKWVGISRGWVFRRPILDDLRSGVDSLIKNGSDKEVSTFLFHGPAASSKTTSIELLGYELYREKGVPVIFVRPEREQIDFLVIDSFYRFLTDSLTAESRRTAEQPRGIPHASSKPFPIIIIIDEAATRLQSIQRLPQYLKSRGIPAAILAVSRTNEWYMAYGDKKGFKVDREIQVTDKVDFEREEPQRLVTHLRQLGVLRSAQDDEYWTEKISSEWDESFFTAVYNLAEPTRPPLSLAIRNEYDQLSSLAKAAYKYVCIFFKYGLSLDLELLVRSLGSTYEEFIEKIYDPASLGVLIEDEMLSGEIRFRARNRLVAEKIIDYVYGDFDEFLDDLRLIAGSLLPHNSNEIETIRSLLITRIGPRGSQPIKDKLKLIPVFESALRAGMRDSAMMHHFGLLLLDQGEYEDATENLSVALEILNDSEEMKHFRSESRQNLYNSLGMAAARHGLALQRNGKDEAANDKFRQAKDSFRVARTGNYPNPYPYYSEAWMYLNNAKNLVGIEKLEECSNALVVLDEAEGNISAEDVPTLQEMEAKIREYLSTIENLSILQNELEGVDQALGAYLQGRLGIGEDEPESQVEQAYSILLDAVKVDPNHIPCLRLVARLHHKLHPEDWIGWREFLSRLYDLQSENRLGLLLNLSLCEAQLGNYPDAFRFAEELEAESTGHPRRSGVFDLIRDDDKPRQFSGIVKKIPHPRVGWLRCDELGVDLKFIPIRQKFSVSSGSSVGFNLALNYRGYLAIELRPGE
ncbi:MAG: SIR2 family protein [Nitrososphaerales archaeon]